MSWRIVQGDALERLREMPDESVQCCVTSPPYWGLRDYGLEPAGWPAVQYVLPGGTVDVEAMTCCLGLEETPQQFLGHLVVLFRELARVLRSDGTLWLNLGDSYANGGCGARDPQRWPKQSRNDHMPQHRPKRRHGAKPKDLLGIPWLAALALREDGWYLRKENIWHKLTPMPESVTDRPTKAHEQVFLLSRSPRYYYDNDAVRTPLAAKTLTTFGTNRQQNRGGDLVKSDNWARDVPNREAKRGEDGQPLGANLRSVWPLASAPYPDAHFATFPPDLVKPCLLAGTPPKVCGECGAPWERQTDVSYENPGNRTTNGPRSLAQRHETAGFEQRLEKRVTTTGWQPTCDHGDGSGRAVVLDPFAGAGTTNLVATQLGRDSIGIELNPSYAKMAEDRIHRWEANPAGHLRSKPRDVGDGQGSLLALATSSEEEGLG